MRLIHGVGFGIGLVCVLMTTAVSLQAQSQQSNQQSSQQSNGDSNTNPSQQQNLPYTPPSAPPGGYGNAATGVYTGKGSVGFGSDGNTGSIQNGSGGTGSGGIVRSISSLSNLKVDDPPQNQQQLEQQQARARNAERQKQLVADTQKLVALANELQVEVNQSTKDMLSLDVVRKADEIDKLARTVRDKMKNAN